MGSVLEGRHIIHVCVMAQVMVHFKLPLLEALHRLGARQTIYCSDIQYNRKSSEAYVEGGDIHLLRSMGYHVHVGPFTRRPGVSTPLCISSLTGYLRNAAPDMVLAHQPMGALVGIISARRARVPAKVYFSGALKRVTTMDKLIYKYGEHFIMRAADAVMLNNLEDYEYARSVPGVGEKAYFVSASEGCGIDTDIFNSHSRVNSRASIRSELGYKDSDIVIGFAGRLEWEKGFRELADAASVLRGRQTGERARFLIIGTGPDDMAIMSMIKKRGLADIFRFAGYQRDVLRYFSALDICTLPSYREGLPTVILQAMALGIPCVASNVRGSRELIEHGKCGLIAGPHDAAALADALYTLVLDPGLRVKMGQHAQERIQLNYSQDKLLPETVRIVEEVAKGFFL